ncbi:FixH family protein [Candidatus Pseudothioglobus singularis]|nr:FixH family protein [Candidatus Pseudothioglobus singularis]
MQKKLGILFVSLALMVLAACGTDGETEHEHDHSESSGEELTALEVDFEVPDTVQVGETVELKATVTFGDELVEDADEVLFEVWPQGNEEDSWEVEGTHQGEGVYTAETTFEEEGTYEAYAHTTARDQHTMPLVSIEVESAE